MALAVSVYQEQVIHHMAELGLRQASPEVRSVEQVEEGAVRSISTLVTAHRVEEMGRHQESAHQAQKILAVAVEVVVQNAYAGGAGGSGVVIIRYADTFDDLTSISGGLTYEKTTPTGFKVYSFTAGTGTVTV